MYGGFRIHPAPLPPNGNVTRKKQPPSICSFPAVARNHSQTSPDRPDRACLSCLGLGHARARLGAGEPTQGARDSQLCELAPGPWLLGAIFRAVAHPWLHFPDSRIRLS